MRMHRTTLSFLFCSLPLLAAADPAPQASAVDPGFTSLVAAGKYATAGTTYGTPEWLASPKHLAAYTRLLVDDYVFTLNYQLFALKDMAPGETVASLRGKPGQYQMMPNQLEQLLHDAYQKSPADPDINYAVGYYLSHMDACGCAQPIVFQGDDARDGAYFQRAEKGGISDAWSLFRLGVYQQTADPPKLDDAAAYYRRSLALDPKLTDARYNLASVLFHTGHADEAAKEAQAALDGYAPEDKGLNADTHALYGRILANQGDYKGAEPQFRRALEIQPWHQEAFAFLLQVLRTQKRDDDYVKTVLDYIAIDYSNTLMFNNYLETLDQIGLSPADDHVETALLALKLPDEKTGPLYFNLGKFAGMKQQPKEALRRFQLSLAAFKRTPHPPQQALDALDQLISQLKNSP